MRTIRAASLIVPLVFVAACTSGPVERAGELHTELNERMRRTLAAFDRANHDAMNEARDTLVRLFRETFDAAGLPGDPPVPPVPRRPAARKKTRAGAAGGSGGGAKRPTRKKKSTATRAKKKTTTKKKR